MIRNLLRQLDVTVSVNVPFSSKAEVKAAMNALIPDNVRFPKGLSMKMFSRGTTLIIELASNNVPTTTILSTIDEILEHVSISKKVMTG